MDPHCVTIPNDDDVITVEAEFKHPFLIKKKKNFGTVVKNFFRDTVFKNRYMYFLCVQERLKKILSFFCHFSGKLFLWFFDHHEN